ncbi:hypothetical protein [Coleofasciculus chthonoplastes]|uniref:hypothetical protein n=1 Tax=Coleofasciculus chthonoplastes TaxID=64178 RepID=UPI003302E44C
MKVANPKLTLCAFHLRNNLAQGEDEPVNNANHLWEECQRIGQKLHVPRLESLIERLQESNGQIGVSSNQDNSRYLELLQPENTLKFSAIPEGSKLQLRGEVYPLQIHDTYAVDITLRYPYPNVDVNQLEGLNPQGCLLPSQIKASLGQTLVFFAHPEGQIQDIQEFANDCLAAILPKSEVEQFLRSPPTQGIFLGSPIFEYENNREHPTEHCHILIWLNCHPETATLEAAGDYYQSLINLLCCRHKILYAYSESRWCNQKARLLYRKLEVKAKAFRQLPSEPTPKLKQLKEWLTEIPTLAFEYANYMRDMEFHRTTIETNIINYKFWLKQLQDIGIQNRDNLDFLEQLIKDTQDNFIPQISTDLFYLMPSQQLFGQMIEASRGIVETEQAERDRALQDTVAIVGVGLATSAVGATVAPYIIPTEPRQPILPPFSTNHLHPLTQSLLLSLIFGVTGAVITKGYTSVMQNRGAIAGCMKKLIQGDSNKTAKLSGNTQQTLPQSKKQNQ